MIHSKHPPHNSASACTFPSNWHNLLPKRPPKNSSMGLKIPGRKHGVEKSYQKESL
jgi:hypothetical protein